MSARGKFLTIAAAGTLAVLTAGATGSSADSTTTCFGEKATIVGTEGDDVIAGTKRDDVIVALGGNDTIDARDGDDLVCAGDGNDIVNGGDGFVSGIDGGAGDDTIDGGDAAIGIAIYRTAPGPVTVDLAAGTASGWGEDKLVNIDAVIGSRAADSLTGDNEFNLLSGGYGNDVINGGGGPDVLSGDEGADTIDGGSGRDEASYYDAGHGIVVDLTAGTARGWGADRLTHIEDVDGSRYADTIRGNGQSNEVDGESGRDVLVGRTGNDRLTGSAGRDVADGGRGRDRCSAERRIRCP
jgi:Ca2+-binding RTX toxin-like protein